MNKIFDLLSGQNELERIAQKGDVRLLNEYLKSHPVLIPKRPKQFLDAASLTQADLLRVIEADTAALANEPFEPWILELDGKRRLPAFSSPKTLETFAKKISKELNKVFGLGYDEFHVFDITKSHAVGVVDLNMFSARSWEVEVR